MKIRRLNEDAKRFYIDEIVSAPSGKTETERHSFATLDELKKYCKDAGLTKDDIANCGGCDVRDLCEDVNKHTSRSRVKLEVKYEVYGRYGTGGQVKKGRVSGADEVDALMNMLDHVHMYIDSDFADEFEEENGRRPTTEDIVECLDSQNGDGCDLIYYITNLTTGKMIFDGGVSEEEEDWDDLDESADSKLYTKPNGEYLVKADSGKGYTAFSRDNVAIGGIDNEDADSDDKAIDKFKRNEYSECLNEAYFDTAEYRIQKYEDDIPELMAGMHDDYMEGKLDAARYAEVLKKVYDALAECDYKHTMNSPVVMKGTGKRVLDALAKLDETLNEGSEKYYAAKYTAVDNSGNKTVKKICFRCDGTIEDAEKEVDALIKEPYTELKVTGSCLKGVAEKDGFELVEEVVAEGAANKYRFELKGYPLYRDYSYGGLIEEIIESESFCEAIDKLDRTLPYTGTFDIAYTSAYDDLYDEYDHDDEKIDNRIEEDPSVQEKILTDISNRLSMSNGDGSSIVVLLKDLVSDIVIFADDQKPLEYERGAGWDDDYDDEYSDDFDESLENCSGIKAHKVIMGENANDVNPGDIDGTEGPTGDKTEDIEFVMDEYIASDFAMDAVNKLSPTKYEVTYNGNTVLLEFDPKWPEYVYTINGKGPHSHSSYEWIISDIRDYVNTFCAADNVFDDEF